MFFFMLLSSNTAVMRVELISFTYAAAQVCVLRFVRLWCRVFFLDVVVSECKNEKSRKETKKKNTTHTECEQALHVVCALCVFLYDWSSFIHIFYSLIRSVSHSFIHAFFFLLSIHLLVVHSQWMHISWSVAFNLYMLQRVQLSDIISYIHTFFVFNVLVFSRYCSLLYLSCWVVLRRLLLLKCCLLLRALLIVYAMHVIFVMNK